MKQFAITFSAILAAAILIWWGKPYFDHAREVSREKHIHALQMQAYLTIAVSSLETAKTWGGNDSDEFRRAKDTLQTTISQAEGWFEHNPETRDAEADARLQEAHKALDEAEQALQEFALSSAVSNVEEIYDSPSRRAQERLAARQELENTYNQVKAYFDVHRPATSDEEKKIKETFERADKTRDRYPLPQ